MQRKTTQAGFSQKAAAKKAQAEPVAIWPENLNPRQAATYTALSLSLLAKLRMAGKRQRGPAFVKIGSAVLYRRRDLDDWLAANIVVAAA